MEQLNSFFELRKKKGKWNKILKVFKKVTKSKQIELSKSKQITEVRRFVKLY